MTAVLFQGSTHGQLDPEKRRLIQLAYNQPMQGRSPISGYAFYYYNKPDFINTNMILRLAVAPVYLDSELGFKGLLGENTDFGIGLAGGGFADTYSEIRQGNYMREESFTGHGAEVSASIYYLFNPDWRVPISWIGRATVHHAIYSKEDRTSDDFELPPDVTSYNFRTGIRVGGREPTLTSPLAAELSIWYQLHVRGEYGEYGFNDDRNLEAQSHLFWARTLLKYTFEELKEIAFKDFIVILDMMWWRISTDPARSY